MSVDRDQARNIAALAKLRFDEAELDRMTAELNHILEHVEALRSLDLSPEKGGAPPMSEARASTRGPSAEQPDELRGGAQAIAPDWREGFFVVPPLPGVRAEDGA